MKDDKNLHQTIQSAIALGCDPAKVGQAAASNNWSKDLNSLIEQKLEFDQLRGLGAGESKLTVNLIEEKTPKRTASRRLFSPTGNTPKYTPNQNLKEEKSEEFQTPSSNSSIANRIITRKNRAVI